VAALTALVALLTAADTTRRRTAVLGALAADVASLAAAVAALLSLRCGALTAQVTLVAAVVASGVALAGAVGRTVSRVAAYMISESSSKRYFMKLPKEDSCVVLFSCRLVYPAVWLECDLRNGIFG
jgi:hypothetical protein